MYIIRSIRWPFLLFMWLVPEELATFYRTPTFLEENFSPRCEKFTSFVVYIFVLFDTSGDFRTQLNYHWNLCSNSFIFFRTFARFCQSLRNFMKSTKAAGFKKVIFLLKQFSKSMILYDINIFFILIVAGILEGLGLVETVEDDRGGLIYR